MFENNEPCNPKCISGCGYLSLQVNDKALTSCFKDSCECELPIGEKLLTPKTFYTMSIND